jgi:hypothetical protein
MLLFLLFMGGHFELSKDGHPSKQNMRPIIAELKDSRTTPHPEWVWKHGILYFVGNPRKFLRRNFSENQFSYLRSGATMYLEGALSLFMLALTSAFVTVFTVGKINMEKVTLCPVANELRLYLSVLLWFGFLCTAICWLATVRGSPSSKMVWLFIYFLGFLEFVTNAIGCVYVIRGIHNMCSENMPTVFAATATAVFVWGWFTVIAVISFVAYLRKWNAIRKEKREAIEREQRWKGNAGSPTKKKNDEVSLLGKEE